MDYYKLKYMSSKTALKERKKKKNKKIIMVVIFIENLIEYKFLLKQNTLLQDLKQI